ncbi:GcrA family cell cycle regulator [Methylobacterium radiotolerans]|uniref:GcrA family cell cycle regulator n=1 Tax=Methylobacterium radiotolerans TaxID=31998 RepID=UPI0038D0F9BF
MTALPIYELRRGQCRYAVSPSDAREFLFCAEPVEYEGCPYCPEHAARCFDRRLAETKRAHAERAALMRAGRKVDVRGQAGPVKLAILQHKTVEIDADGAAE